MVLRPERHGPAASYYAFKGIMYFFSSSHAVLWTHVLWQLVAMLVLGFGGTIVFFIYLLSPQANFLYINIGLPEVISWMVAVAVVLLECSLSMVTVVELFFGASQDLIYLETLRIEKVDLEGVPGLTLRRPLVGRIFRALFRITIFVATLPCNLAPVVGTLFFMWVNGGVVAWDLHVLYYQTKGLDTMGRMKFFCSHWSDYFWCGFSCELLVIVPFLNLISMFTNYIGAGLWVADMEARGTGAKETNRVPIL